MRKKAPAGRPGKQAPARIFRLAGRVGVFQKIRQPDGFDCPLSLGFDCSLSLGFDCSLSLGFDCPLSLGFDCSLSLGFDCPLSLGF